MEKIKIGAKSKFLPSPIFVVGANVEEKPNYSLLCGSIMGNITINIGKTSHNYKGIKENGTFSINFPSEATIKYADYCGLISGKEADKARQFTTYYGILGNAPMIKEFPISFECKVIKELDFGAWAMLVGEIAEVYSEDIYLTNGWPDVNKIKPILYAMPNDYWKIGEYYSRAGIGADLIK